MRTKWGVLILTLTLIIGLVSPGAMVANASVSTTLSDNTKIRVFTEDTDEGEIDKGSTGDQNEIEIDKTDTENHREAGKEKKERLTVKEAYLPLELKSTKQSKTSVNLQWKIVPGAEYYLVYGNKAGKTLKQLASVRKNTYRVEKLKKSSYYNFVVIAVDSSGNQLAKSTPIYVATKGRGNYKSITVKVRSIKINEKKVKGDSAKPVIKKKISIKAGDQIRLKVTAKKAGKKLKKYTPVRYESSDPEIATVTTNGLVKAKRKGICRIFAYLQNGIGKSVKVNVD